MWKSPPGYEKVNTNYASLDSEVFERRVGRGEDDDDDEEEEEDDDSDSTDTGSFSPRKRKYVWDY